MTAKEIVNAYKAAQDLQGLVLPYKLARQLSQLKKRLSEELDIVAEMERKLLDTYKGTSDGKKYEFPTVDDARAFYAAYSEALRDDAEITLPIVDLSDYIDQITISAASIEALEGIVIFEKEAELDG